MRSFKQTFLPLLSSSCLIGLFFACLPAAVAPQSYSLHQNLGREEILQKVLQQRRHYIDTFSNLTADETKITEIFDSQRKIEKQRKQVAYFLVYQSQLDDDSVSEYRFIREVDGKPVHQQVERAEKLFNQLARAGSLERERKRLREENLRYTLRYYRWDLTLHPAGQLEEKLWPEYSYEIGERGKLGDRDIVVLRYRRKSLYPVEAKRILSAFKDPHIGDQGQLWLDANTFQIHRWENEWIVRQTETGNRLVYLRDEVEYVQSDWGILVPKRIVVSFFDKLRYKSQEPHTVLGGRIIYTYDSFKRFKVTSQEELNPIKKG